MSLKKWFGTAEPEEPTRQEQRADPRLSVHAQVLISDDPQTSDDELEGAELVDFASGGLRLRMDKEIEVGQTLWVRTTVTHVSQHGVSTEIGVTWDADRSDAKPLPIPVSSESPTPDS